MTPSSFQPMGRMHLDLIVLHVVDALASPCGEHMPADDKRCQ